MKKLFFLAVFVSVLVGLPASVGAYGIAKGDQLISVFAGAGGTTNDTSLRLDLRDEAGHSLAKSQDLGWGGESVSFGVQYLYAVNPYWAFWCRIPSTIF